MAPHHTLFGLITSKDLLGVQGGASRVTSRSSSNDQLTTMLTQITSSIQNLSSNKNQSDPMTMMMMMMMMGGGGGGGGAVAAAPPPPPPPPAPAAPVVNISTSVRH
ncbi:MAG TPA: hypothetical protein VHT91_11440 [Kofleriaceae bacterium]|nr:hypothetical protein [Kofleriaceae bacterium]